MKTDTAPIAAGLDLGTTKSLAAFLRPGMARPELAAGALGENATPSVVFLGASGTVLVGEAALQASRRVPGTLVRNAKRDLGGTPWSIDVRGRVYTPVIATSLLLYRLLDDLNCAAGAKVREAVLVVPACFGDLERAAIFDAARIAGLEKVHAINEPTAAALAYELEAPSKSQDVRRVLVYSLGGGSFDASLVEIAPGAIRVLASVGQHRLGGTDWDDELLNLVAEEVAGLVGIDPREDPVDRAELLVRVERAKQVLSREEQVSVSAPLPVLGREVTCVVTRAEFERRTSYLLDQTETLLEAIREKTGVAWGDVEAVLPIGGGAAMPMVTALLRRVTGREPLVLTNPDEPAVRGAVHHASSILSAGVGLRSVSDLARAAPEGPAGITTEKPKLKRPKYVPPGQRARLVPDYETTGELPLLPGRIGPPVIRDLIGKGLGVLVRNRLGFKNVVLIPAQTPIPARQTRAFVTIKDAQTTVIVKVLEGDDPSPERCRLLGTLLVEGLPPERKAGASVEVALSFDQDGRVQVSAKDTASGKEARATLTRDGALAARTIEELRAQVAGRASGAASAAVALRPLR